MKTILPAKESIAQLWGHPKPKDTKYRLMKYLLQSDVEDGMLLHNNVTGHLILLTDEESKILQDLPAKPTEQMQELIANHFLVPDDFEEYRSVNQLRSIFQNRHTGDAVNHYVILPTTFCNAHCFYCYESNYQHIHMSEETADKIIDYIDEHHKGKNVKLAWFGGEPLLGIKRIDQISQGLKDRNIPFYATMISNGYLFDEQIVQRGVDLWNLQRVQITLDGPEETYNKVKAYAGVQGSPYQRVHKNIETLSKNKVYVAIRLNLDFYNKDEIRKLMGELVERYSDNEYVRVYISILYNNQGFEPVHRTPDEYVELLQIYEQFVQELQKTHMGQERRKIPELRYHQCMADDPHSVLIQPDGSLCRCEHECVTDRYGSIQEGILDQQKLQQWKERVDRSDDCTQCCLYPYCYLLKRCMGESDPCIEGVRLTYQKQHVDLIKSVYQKKQEEKKNEKV